MPKRGLFSPLLCALLLLSAAAVPTFALTSAKASSQGTRQFSLFSLLLAANDREQDGLTGPVRRVKTETAKITVKNGKPFEAARVLLETTTYDNKGGKVDNAYFLAAGGSLTGKEVYKYDDKGNMVEMTLQNEDGTLASKEVYAYEIDQFGNWTKMTTSVAIIEGGKLSFEPSEVSYRTISYFLDEATLAKMSQPAAAASTPNTTAAPAPVNSTGKMGAAAAASPAAVKSPAATSANTTPVVVNKNTNKAAPVALSTLSAMDKAVALNASPVLSTSAASSGGPVVNADGDAPEIIKPRGPLKPVSGGILNGKALSLPSPIYPEMARRVRATGLVEVEVVIDMTGKVISAKASGGPGMLREAAERAAMQARFSPTLLTGQPVKVSGTITYNFTLAP